jgi:hypothetical protein
MDKINLTITDAAKDLLVEHIRGSEIDDPISTVVWWGEGKSISPEGVETKLSPGWGVAWYKPSQIPKEEIQSIDGIKFVFCQGEKSEELNGKLLDVKDGKFVIK